MFTLINSERAKVGKKPVGFINPALYKAPASAFTDIRSGDNKCKREVTLLFVELIFFFFFEGTEGHFLLLLLLF